MYFMARYPYILNLSAGFPCFHALPTAAVTCLQHLPKEDDAILDTPLLKPIRERETGPLQEELRSVVQKVRLVRSGLAVRAVRSEDQ